MSESHVVTKRQQLSEFTLAIYAAITLLGVIAAASWKGLFVDEVELTVIIVATTVTVAVAHLWASVAAHRLVHHKPPSREEWREELRNAAAVFVVGGLAIAAFLISGMFGMELAGEVVATLLMLVAVLFVVGVVGARRERRSWPIAAGIGLLDASIGMAILLAKVIFGA
jgi:peptidoglycan/LPS O-acetylase OafA/YrhL